jgi:hypothetical protein
VQKHKDAILQAYKSQRPYTIVLRNAFVRTNELFFVYEPVVAQYIDPPPALERARIPIAR